MKENDKNECGFYHITDIIEVVPNKKEEFNCEEIDAYYVENLKQILDFKKKRRAPKDIPYIEKIEQYLKNRGISIWVIKKTKSCSTLNIDNTISQMEQKINEECKTEDEIESIKESRHIEKRKSFMERMSAHLEKHEWFYGAIIGLLGQAMLTMLSRQ